MGASGSMQDRNRYNGMGSASGGALTDLYGKLQQNGTYGARPQQTGNPPFNSYDGAVRQGKDRGQQQSRGQIDFGGGVSLSPNEAAGAFFSGNPIKLTRQQYEQMTGRSLSRGYDQSIRSGKGGAASGTQSGGGLANARVGINPPLRSDQAVRQGK